MDYPFLPAHLRHLTELKVTAPVLQHIYQKKQCAERTLLEKIYPEVNLVLQQVCFYEMQRQKEHTGLDQSSLIYSPFTINRKIIM